MANDNEGKDMSVNGLAMELLQEIKSQTKRWMVASFAVIILWFATIIGFIWYLNQYDFTSTVEQTGVYTLSDSQGNVISSDITSGQIKDILEVLDGENESNQKED